MEQIETIMPIMVLMTGLAVGIRHAFEPDHVVAVSTQILKSKLDKSSTKQLIRQSITKSSILGAIWGTGHTTSLVFVGFLVSALAITIHDHIFSGFEFLVGIMLVLLGTITILNKKIQFKHKHPHQHKDGTIHLDEHTHEDHNHRHAHKSYLIGLVHGLAGSGGLVVLMAATLDNFAMSLGFILIFGIGSIIGMALVGSIMGIPFAFGNRVKLIQQIFRYVAGVSSLVIGFSIMYQIGLVEHLFGF